MTVDKELKVFIAAMMATLAVVTAARGLHHRAATVNATATHKAPFVLIIDAGHGGEDGGAVTSDGLTESSINLDIALRLDSLSAFFGVETVLTRDSETLTYSAESTTTRVRKAEDQKRRIELVRGTPNAVFLSIHQNTYPTAAPYGSQVLFAKTAGSEELGIRLQELLKTTLDASNRRAAERIPESILLMNSIDCPAVLVECGFLSNPAEEALLRTDEHRLKLAVILAAGILQIRETLATQIQNEAA